AQDAHEAIRPTNINLTPEHVAPYLEPEYLALYRLIWNRAVASQMADAKMENTRVEVPVGKYLFIVTGTTIKFPGHLAIYEEGRDEIGKSESDESGAEAAPVDDRGNRLPPMEKGDTLKVPKVEGVQHFTQPPPRFTEAGLIKELEKQGIGRPSTYASIISTIQGKEYTEKDKGVFKPTELGFIITDMLKESFPHILDVKFTAMMENQLDEVEEGKVDWVELLKNFYLPFEKRLEVANSQMRNLKAEIIQTEHTCDKCGSPMIVRWGRNGKFLACSAYPNCKNTKPIIMGEDGTVEIVKDEVTDKVCPNCGKQMVIKSGRRGRFLACSGYPDCKTSQPLPIGVKCARPGCSGELLERRSGKGKTFYACSAYPECNFSVWELPVKVKCEACGEEKFMVGKEPKQKVLGCERKECPYPQAYSAEKAEAARAASAARIEAKKSGGAKKPKEEKEGVTV
ncbi:topoisomerase DNA-binding C4 zinc finger domain-containing protein, partial [Candidatus Sumerlaeota bacterium]|nr:topoisomerase DNA-binding C4 zinc finger domain-containing protein [Candidatus Sumerlaeota bacterium]